MWIRITQSHLLMNFVKLVCTQLHNIFIWNYIISSYNLSQLTKHFTKKKISFSICFFPISGNCWVKVNNGIEVLSFSANMSSLSNMKQFPIKDHWNINPISIERIAKNVCNHPSGLSIRQSKSGYTHSICSRIAFPTPQVYVQHRCSIYI